MQNQQITDFRERPLLFIDLEMTGLDPRVHEILEVGALLVDGGTLEIKSEYETKIKPENIENADPKALELNRYQEKEWTKAVPLRQVLEKLNELAPQGMIAGWNITFDWMFLEMAYRQHDIKPAFDYHKIDVLGIAWYWALKHPEIKEVKLSKFCEYFKIDRKDAHRALADIKATFAVFKKLVS